ncbi:hypothetical protein Y032_0075g955 [Ancylostoma ceylanicum]|uniref:Uncharacterized protein n=1 Tax=Ancylostoma ceylanicum TaxID=53326 RepID=A0A016TW50_9BILA|nr:hypothetical protein Y032_0075g955 [Ancylostoma ceylanicum]
MFPPYILYCSKARFFLFLPIHYYSNPQIFAVVFGLELKCTCLLKFVPYCFVDSYSIARERLGYKILPTYAGGNTEQNGSPVLAQVI